MKNSYYLILAALLFLNCKSAKYDGLSDGLYAEIATKKGAILMELYAKEVPMTVASFVSLAEGTNNKVSELLKGKPYFNGLKFHRVSA